ncbi:PAXIP1-associated glutamate-rich protein 1-like [Ptychodera flava]|uniref:PAXIP1-associated glutamate-rich protein 1-like n=1 Tax=Ptychodera flava TaxID=63121 RepID=UPI003969F9BB
MTVYGFVTMETDMEKESAMETESTSENKEQSTEEKSEENAPDLDFNILGTDSEDETSEKGDKPETKDRCTWEPPPKVIVELYQKLDKEGILELDWKCPPRKLPEEEAKELEEAARQEMASGKDAVSEEKEEEPTEFDDFDELSVDVKKSTVTPRRTPGSGGREGKGSSKKRTARMDKVFTDMRRHKKMDEAGDQLPDEGMEFETTPHRTPGRQFRMRQRDFP